MFSCTKRPEIIAEFPSPDGKYKFVAYEKIDRKKRELHISVIESNKKIKRKDSANITCGIINTKYQKNDLKVFWHGKDVWGYSGSLIFPKGLKNKKIAYNNTPLTKETIFEFGICKCKDYDPQKIIRYVDWKTNFHNPKLNPPPPPNRTKQVNEQNWALKYTDESYVSVFEQDNKYYIKESCFGGPYTLHFKGNEIVISPSFKMSQDRRHLPDIIIDGLLSETSSKTTFKAAIRRSHSSVEGYFSIEELTSNIYNLAFFNEDGDTILKSTMTSFKNLPNFHFDNTCQSTLPKN